MRSRPGNPGRGGPALPTTVRSLRFPDATWRELETRAAARGTSLHALLREIIVGYLEGAPSTGGRP